MNTRTNLVTANRIWQIIGDASADRWASPQLKPESFPDEANSEPHLLYLKLRHAVATQATAAARTLLSQLAAAATGLPELVVSGLEVAREVLPRREIDLVLSKVVARPIDDKGRKRYLAALLRAMIWSSPQGRAVVGRKILAELREGLPVPSAALARLLGYLLETGDEPPGATTAFLLALKHLANDQIRRPVLRLHLSAPELYLLEEPEREQIRQLAIKDPQTAFLLGLCQDHWGLREDSLANLRRSLPVVGRGIDEARQVFEVAARRGDGALALRSIACLSKRPVADLPTLLTLAPWAAKLDLAPFWQKILEAAAENPTLRTDHTQIRTLLCSALFQADRPAGALSIYLELPSRKFANVGLRMRVIETLIAHGREEAARAELEFIPDVTREHRIHFLSLRLRAADQADDADEHRRLLAEAPDNFLEDTSFRTELALRYFRDRRFRDLRQLLDDGPFEDPALQLLRLVAAARCQEYGLVREELDFDRLEPPPIPHRRLWQSLRRPLAAAALYSFAIAGQWRRVDELLKQIRFEDPDDPLPTFFLYLTSAYQHLEQPDDPATSFRQICDAFEQLLVLATGRLDIELAVAFLERSPLANPLACPEPRRAQELTAYLQYLMLARIEELLPALEDHQPAAFRDITAGLEEPADLRVTLALLRRTEDLTDGD